MERATYVQRDGHVTRHSVAPDESILNIERDLIAHLNEGPYSSDFLAKLRDYCESRLQARAEARSAGKMVFPQAAFWEIQ
jgi:hypothetical protein